MFIGVVPAFDLHVEHFILDMRSGDLQGRNAVDHVDHQTEPVDLVLYRQLQRRIDAAFFLIAAHMEILVIIAAIGQAVYQPGITVEVEHHHFIQGK